MISSLDMKYVVCEHTTKFMVVPVRLWSVTESEPDPEMGPDLPDWIGKAMGFFALLILLSAVIAVFGVLLPRFL